MVYSAFDHELRAEVALKRLLQRTPEEVDFLKQEFRVLARVHHPNLVPLLELFSDGGDAFFTMMKVPGHPWSVPEVGDEDPTPRINVIDQHLPGLLLGVNALHSSRIAHGDIKPSNILIGPEGPVFLDFGFARSVVTSPMAATFAGSPSYAAPELFTGGSAGLSSDLYSLGALLYESITGRLPADPSSPRFLRDLTDGTRPRLLALVPQAPTVLAEAIEAALAPAANDRPTVEDFATALGIALPDAAPETEPPFVGRGDALRVLHSGMDAPGSCRVIEVRGPSGIGKSRVCREFARRVREHGGALVLRGRASRREAVPFGGFDQIAEELAGQLSRSQALRRATEDHDLAEAGRLFPVLGALAALPAPPGASPSEQRTRGTIALTRILHSLARRTRVVMLLDDFQWASEDCGALFDQLTSGDDPAPVLWVLGVRTDATDASPGGASADEILELGPLTPTESRAIWDALRNADEGRPTLPPEAEGSPFLLQQLATLPGAASGPHHSIREHLADWGADAQRLVELVSVAEEPLSDGVLLRAAGLDARSWPLLHELETRRWVSGGPASSRRSFRPYHHRIAETVRELLDKDELRSRHISLHEHLLGEPEGTAGRLFVHARGAGQTALARTHATAAAQAAKQSLAFADAASWFEEAVALDPEPGQTPELCESAGRCYVLAGRSDRAWLSYQQAAESKEADRDPAEVIRLRAIASSLRVKAGDVDEGLGMLERLFPQVGRPLPPTDGAALRESLWRRLVFVLFRRPAAIKPGAPTPAQLAYLTLLHESSGTLAQTRFPVADCIALRHLGAAVRYGDSNHIVRALGYEAMVEASIGGRLLVRRAGGLLSAMERMADTSTATRAYVHICRSSVAWSTGSWQACVDEARAAEGAWVDSGEGTPNELAIIRLYLFSGLWWQGRVDEIAALLPVLLKDARARRDPFAERTFMTGEPSGAAVAAGQAHRVVEFAEGMAGTWTGDTADTQRFQRLTGLVRALLYLGRPEEAWDAIEREWPAMKAGLYPSMAMTGSILWFMRGRTAAAIAAKARIGGRNPRPFLRELRRAERQLAKKKTNVSRNGAVFFLRATRALLSGDPEDASRTLAEARVEFDKAGMRLLALTCGALGGGAGAAESLEELGGLGVVDPMRLCSALAPGWGPAPPAGA